MGDTKPKSSVPKTAKGKISVGSDGTIHVKGAPKKSAPKAKRAKQAATPDPQPQQQEGKGSGCGGCLLNILGLCVAGTVFAFLLDLLVRIF